MPISRLSYKQDSIPVRCVPSAAVTVMGGASGLCDSGGMCFGGGCSSHGDVCIPACTEADIPPVDRMTDRCKNITLRTVVKERCVVSCETLTYGSD